jgi:hypothetical protein
MNRLLMLVGVAVVAAAMYVAASPASQQSKGPTAKQFKALQKKVTSLTKELKTVKPEADISASYILTCLSSVSAGSITINAMPVSRRGSSTSGYWFGTTAAPPTSTTTALDIDTAAPTDVLQEFDPSCLSGALRHSAARSGITRLRYGMAKDTR